MMEIKLKKARDANFTPAGLIYEWAKENGADDSETYYDRRILLYNGRKYVYDHLSIKHIDDSTDEITVFLVPFLPYKPSRRL